MKDIRNLCWGVASAVALLAGAANASAQELVKIAADQRGAWEAAAPELGQQAGILKMHGIVLDLRYTQDDGETERHVMSGSVDLGLAVGAMAAMRSNARGAPVRIIGANMSRKLLVCAVDFADTDHQGPRRQDHRLCGTGLLQSLRRPRPDQAVPCQGAADIDRGSSRNVGGTQRRARIDVGWAVGRSV